MILNRRCLIHSTNVLLINQMVLSCKMQVFFQTKWHKKFLCCCHDKKSVLTLIILIMFWGRSSNLTTQIHQYFNFEVWIGTELPDIRGPSIYRHRIYTTYTRHAPYHDTYPQPILPTKKTRIVNRDRRRISIQPFFTVQKII